MARRVAQLRFDVGTHGKTSGAIHRAAAPAGSELGATLILAHGAGAPRTHPLVTGLATRIAAYGIDVVTFNFLYAEAGRRMPDRPELLEACWWAVIAKVCAKIGSSSPLFVGGRSMGGRFATRVAAGTARPQLDGVVCIGYPLHPSGRPEVTREEILAVDLPLLVVQGTKDALGSAAEMKRFLAGRARMRVHAIEGADHSFGGDAPLDEAARAVARFIERRSRRKERKR